MSLYYSVRQGVRHVAQSKGFFSATHSFLFYIFSRYEHSNRVYSLTSSHARRHWKLYGSVITFVSYEFAWKQSCTVNFRVRWKIRDSGPANLKWLKGASASSPIFSASRCISSATLPVSFAWFSILQRQRPIKSSAHDSSLAAVFSIGCSDSNRVGFSNSKLRYCTLYINQI